MRPLALPAVARSAARIALLAVSVVAFAVTAFPAPASAATHVYFSPGVRRHILPELASAARTIDVAMYAFTDSDLAWALVRAHERGVRVRIYLDGEQAAGRYSKSRFFAQRGLAVRYYRGEGIMHHKFAVIDGRVVVTGSYNWTASAEERNRENALLIEDPVFAARYQAEFDRLWGKS
jgi:phosphatidylserine/phosphatidylglycerophosphate/cardiolipin synthase-like enzyme